MLYILNHFWLFIFILCIIFKFIGHCSVHWVVEISGNSLCSVVLFLMFYGQKPARKYAMPGTGILFITPCLLGATLHLYRQCPYPTIYQWQANWKINMGNSIFTVTFKNKVPGNNSNQGNKKCYRTKLREALGNEKTSHGHGWEEILGNLLPCWK